MTPLLLTALPGEYILIASYMKTASQLLIHLAVDISFHGNKS